MACKQKLQIYQKEAKFESRGREREREEIL